MCFVWGNGCVSTSVMETFFLVIIIVFGGKMTVGSYGVDNIDSVV
jgi:hypothetical protein